MPTQCSRLYCNTWTFCNSWLQFSYHFHEHFLGEFSQKPCDAAWQGNECNVTPASSFLTKEETKIHKEQKACKWQTVSQPGAFLWDGLLTSNLFFSTSVNIKRYLSLPPSSWICNERVNYGIKSTRVGTLCLSLLSLYLLLLENSPGLGKEGGPHRQTAGIWISPPFGEDLEFPLVIPIHVSRNFQSWCFCFMVYEIFWIFS